jgi:hypothetical protein
VKTVLIVGSDFVPSSLPPATRIRLFAKHLIEFGWKPIVLTTRAEYYECPVDDENERLLPESVEIIRTKAMSSLWTRRIGVGDIGMRTLWHHWQAIKSLCCQRKIDLIFIPVPPSVPMVLGRMAHQRFGTPYVIDYIDPWVTDVYKKLPQHQRTLKRSVAEALARIIEPIALKHVAHITGVSKGTTDSVVKRYKWLRDTGTTEIPYGAEADDFEYVLHNPRQNPIFELNDGLIHLSCVGACIPAMHASVRALFQAVRLGLDRKPEEFGRLRLHFVGTSYAPNGSTYHAVEELAREAGIVDHVDERPNRISYLNSLQVMLDSAALFMVGSDAPHYTASKVFPYILARRPLLAIFHEESSVVRTLRQTNSGQVVTFSTKQSLEEKGLEISRHLENILKKRGLGEPQTHWQDFEQYSATAMTSRLAGSFDRALLQGSHSI